MHALSTYFALVAAVAYLPRFSLAIWLPGKAAQLNFYADTGCLQYTGEVEAFWTESPLVGETGSTSAAAPAECITLNMPGDTQTVQTAAMWQNSTTTEPGPGSGLCTFWDDYTCSGEEAVSNYVAASASCLPSRSRNGFLWKSAKCFSNPPDLSLTASTLSTSSTPLPSASSQSSTSTSSTNVVTPSSPPSTTFKPPTLPSSTSIRSSSLPSSQSISFSSTSANQPSSTSLSASSASISASQPAAIRATEKSLPAAAMAGLIVGIVVAFVVLAVLGFCIWRVRKKPEAVILTKYIPTPAESEQAAHRPPLREKSGGVATREASPSAERHQQSIAAELRALREEMGRLNGPSGHGSADLVQAMQQNDALRARIRALEGELELYEFDHSPPGYRD